MEKIRSNVKIKQSKKEAKTKSRNNYAKIRVIITYRI